MSRAEKKFLVPCPCNHCRSRSFSNYFSFWSIGLDWLHICTITPLPLNLQFQLEVVAILQTDLLTAALSTDQQSSHSYDGTASWWIRYVSSCAIYEVCTCPQYGLTFRCAVRTALVHTRCTNAHGLVKAILCKYFQANKFTLHNEPWRNGVHELDWSS